MTRQAAINAMSILGPLSSKVFVRIAAQWNAMGYMIAAMTDPSDT